MNPEKTTQVEHPQAGANGVSAPAGTATEAQAPAQAQVDSFPIQGIDYIEFYVGNARQASHFYRTAMGFNITAYSGRSSADINT